MRRPTYDGAIDAPLELPQPPLRGSTFALRPFQSDDFDAAVTLASDEASARWMPALPAADGEGVAAFFDACREAGEMLHLVIADAASNLYIGEVMLVIGDHRIGEIGCAVVPSARGRRVATEALQLLAEWSFAALGIGRVEVFVAPENRAALRLVANVGFHREGVLRDYWEKNGVRFDMVVFSLLPSDTTGPPRRRAAGAARQRE
jgi:RimJ/RimL family protein N-acetyltransferase